VSCAGKGPIKIVKNIPQGLPPVSIQDWVPIGNIRQLLPLAFIVMAVDMLESTSIARALARKNGYGENSLHSLCLCRCTLVFLANMASRWWLCRYQTFVL
jgi:sulfate transporter 4